MEPQDEAFIRSMIAQGSRAEADTTEHHGRLVWRNGRRHLPARAARASPPARASCSRRSPEAKTVKNRVHWDLNLAGADKDEARAALEARGATFLYRQRGSDSLVHHGGPRGQRILHRLADDETQTVSNEIPAQVSDVFDPTRWRAVEASTTSRT